MIDDVVATVATEGRASEAWRLSQLLIRIAEQSKADFAESVAPFDLPVHLARALFALEGPAAMSDLADRLHCDRSWVTSLADQLEERGLVARVSCEDRRFKLLVLTEGGRELRGRIATAVSDDSLVLSRLDDVQRATLAPLLERMLDGDLDR